MGQKTQSIKFTEQYPCAVKMSIPPTTGDCTVSIEDENGTIAEAIVPREWLQRVCASTIKALSR